MPAAPTAVPRTARRRGAPTGPGRQEQPARQGERPSSPVGPQPERPRPRRRPRPRPYNVPRRPGPVPGLVAVWYPVRYADRLRRRERRLRRPGRLGFPVAPVPWCSGQCRNPRLVGPSPVPTAVRQRAAPRLPAPVLRSSGALPASPLLDPAPLRAARRRDAARPPQALRGRRRLAHRRQLPLRSSALPPRLPQLPRLRRHRCPARVRHRQHPRVPQDHSPLAYLCRLQLQLQFQFPSIPGSPVRMSPGPPHPPCPPCSARQFGSPRPRHPHPNPRCPRSSTVLLAPLPRPHAVSVSAPLSSSESPPSPLRRGRRPTYPPFSARPLATPLRTRCPPKAFPPVSRPRRRTTPPLSYNVPPLRARPCLARRTDSSFRQTRQLRQTRRDLRHRFSS